MFIAYRRGPGEAAECGASAEGWRERFALRWFSGTKYPWRNYSGDKGPLPQPLTPDAALVKAPLRIAGLLFSGGNALRDKFPLLPHHHTGPRGRRFGGTIFPARKAFYPACRPNTKHSPKHELPPLKRSMGFTPIGKLRSRFGPQFAKGCADTEMLREVLHKLDEATLAKLVAAHEIGELEKVRRT
jgi:hypothetical protein